MKSCPVRASSTASDRSKSYAGKPAPRVFETDDLTILTGWAQAVLEALAYAPVLHGEPRFR